MKSILCMIGLHKDKEIGFGSITMPLGVFQCQRCGEVWKWGVDCARIVIDFESEQQKREYLGGFVEDSISLPGPSKPFLKLEHNK